MLTKLEEKLGYLIPVIPTQEQVRAVLHVCRNCAQSAKGRWIRDPQPVVMGLCGVCGDLDVLTSPENYEWE